MYEQMWRREMSWMPWAMKGHLASMEEDNNGSTPVRQTQLVQVPSQGAWSPEGALSQANGKEPAYKDLRDNFFEQGDTPLVRDR